MLEVGGKGDSTFSSWDSALVRPDHQRGDEEAGWGGGSMPPSLHRAVPESENPPDNYETGNCGHVTHSMH